MHKPFICAIAVSSNFLQDDHLNTYIFAEGLRLQYGKGRPVGSMEILKAIIKIDG
jgi:hypothetical protein